MRLRAFDLEADRTLLDLLADSLHEISNRVAAIASEVDQSHGDKLGYVATDVARLIGAVEVLRDRERFFKKVTPTEKGKVMSNEPTKRADNYAARYEVTNPYAAFAAEGGPGIVGKLLVCKKGDWSLGSDGDDVPAEARFLLLVDTMMRGWLKWHDGRVVEAEMGFVKDNFPLRHRYSLPDSDESQWEKLPDGTPRDPWAQSYRVLLVECSARMAT